MNNPWDRRPTETDPAWKAFQTYRDLPPGERSITNAVKAVGAKTGKGRVFERWSSEHDWVTRATAWDTHLDQAVQARILKERGDMAARQVRLGRGLQDKATEGLGELKAGELSAEAVAKLAKAGVDIERLAIGEVTDRVEHSVAEEARGRLKRVFGDEEGKDA